MSIKEKRYEQLQPFITEMGDYLFKRNFLNKVNKLAKEKTFGQELKEALEEPDVIYFDRLKRTFKND